MESQLKALKVAELRELLTKAAVLFASKINKADLIAKVLASQPAIDVYHSLHGTTDLLSPPEEHEQVLQPPPEAAPVEPSPAAASPPVPVQKPASVDENDVTPPENATVTPPTAPEDPEEEKRRKRAERFGIPYVEPPKARPPRGQNAKRAPLDDSKKLATRANRFGTTAPSAAQKRSAPTETVDAEEQDRRKKRAERFGTGPQLAQLKAGRFGIVPFPQK
ncbi:hypothetical protein DXG03_003920 [Asterophora parasitica]|uniref:THO1-MOS11 C-terminal domain-containing protein n=1 Tax=Asterophora parasitica TaxID=117018 RepID=A0A9P7GCT6_9AGAR|nr:hypothetical protein DXG03_003920 [Asterophora parasitica]